ncbi:MAG: hypothetical protein Q6K99_03245 [Thermostichales cyanobacterium BF4_bins_65]
MGRLLIVGLWLGVQGFVVAQPLSPFEDGPEVRVKLLGVKPYWFQGQEYRLDGLGLERQGRRYLMCVSQLYEITDNNEIIAITSKAAQPCPSLQ